MSAKNNIQDQLLNTARKDKLDLTIYLLNGVPLKGKVVSFDNFTIVLEQENKQSLVYKHAISTIIPAKIIKLYTEEAKDNKDTAQG
ncbi:RNA chaperone Hfq [Leptospira noguchii]|uniref:RNA-binding protein Hfq n=3 Tax=Leptospira noguchii TaxID=28182 RepID=M6UK44_9LEPT|nr:RNA chaperone Hfq [Leptospira noguchii]EMO25546.1 RNA chaperone Hfq [Leptospira interrogans serovar Bataviae str. HAI135]EKR74368.1 RNA chaperone Hfq [Leptospira noguchii str. 2006001870]EMI71835.1 RNA chaperone Hfq [Leptospira noguchii str. Bonito]EMM98905.1 RNA chaperone Hfq [Leptospira noguchii str. 2007001578]EMO43181.1 RNA chaperone Hfq [Leptospira noguchii serovar Autumnalis str. ZUN142]